MKTVKERTSRQKRAPASFSEDFTPIVVENVSPQIDGGRFPVKGVQGDAFVVEADIFKDGHDIIKAALLYKEEGRGAWASVPLTFVENDLWRGSFVPKKNSRYRYTVEAWMDPLATWIKNTEKMCAGFPAVPSETLEGIGFLTSVCDTASAQDKKTLVHFIELLRLSEGVSEEVLRIIKDSRLLAIAEKNPLKNAVSRYLKELPLAAERELAVFGAWYELFPRSQSKESGAHGTFKDCVKRLPDIKKMGFDVIYLPPIHPIGKSHRKGPNNTLTAGPADPGSPWAIGSAEGGHKDVHPGLGTIKDFEDFVAAAKDKGIEVALDFALQCSPDHPYIKEHPEWFLHRPDGSIKHAENPPKKYEDIVPINFYPPNREELWEELKSIVLFWIKRGVSVFRVDNPHTKPLYFWEWLIQGIQKDHPEVIFLAEAFTRPKVMKLLAKAGFTQSYTYFTWRNTKDELQEYLEELTQTEMKDYFRPNFFTNTPDILHEYLQKGGPPAFKIRLALAATLSPSYGIYSGYEFFERTPREAGSEEYIDSEKYEIKKRPLDEPENLKDCIARVNFIRNRNPALQRLTNLTFVESRTDSILAYAKVAPADTPSAKPNIILVVVNLDPHNIREDMIRVPVWEWGLDEWQTYQVKDLLTGEKYYWKGSWNYVRLDPHYEPAHIFLLTP